MSDTERGQVGAEQEQPHRLEAIPNGSGDGAHEFSLQPPAMPPEQLAELQRQVEYLLDEAEMGAADTDAYRPSETESSPPGNSTWVPHAEPNGPLPGAFNRDIDDLLADAPPPSRVLSEEELPSIQAGRAASSPMTTPRPIDPTPPRPYSPLGPSTQPRSLLDTPVSAPPPAPEPASLPPMSAADIRTLEGEIITLYDKVNRVLVTRREITGHALSLLREARTILENQPTRISRAEYNIRQVHAILTRARESRRRSGRYVAQILLYLSLWLALVSAGGVALVLYPGDVLGLSSLLLGSRSPLEPHVLPFLWAFVAGGGGGVLGAILSLVVHVRARQEFDSQYVLRYVIQPIMGVVLAALIYFLFLLIFSGMGITLVARAVTAYLPAGLAFPAGLWQEGVYALLFRLTRIFSWGRRRRRR